jgi:branched-chain amino acid transport system ATP-binding protein
LPEPLLRLEGVRTDIGQYHILHGVDLDVPQGAVTMLLGRNGAGKTTTLRSVMGLWKPHTGRVMLAGQNIAGQDPATIARAGVALVPEDMGIFANLTVEENMILAATGGRPDPARLDWLFSVFPPLKTFWKNPAGTLSGGQKQMLATARVSTLARALRQLKDQGATILMVEQNFKLARALGDHAAVMDDGRIVWAGPMATLAADAGLQERLMGLSMEAHA